ncbi:MAG: zinc-finger-containing protein [Serratia sp. (in: enterobacteria)]|uniref:zinc-finger-containing protein n=1 Tax=Serratia sp. (in: enterobacteria) TaxID=616 RepID=UPI003F359DF7
METMNIDRIINCNYCNKPARLVRGYELFPYRRDLSKRYYWVCSPCNAYVACFHDSDAIPVGRLANAQLRAVQRLAYAAFDPLWKEFGMNRLDAYQWLAEQMKMPSAQCRIGMFDTEQCRKATRIATDYKNELQRRA